MNKSMEWECRLFLLDEEKNKIFGRGPLNLLKKTDECGSLRKAAQEMNMAYSKALKIIRYAENKMGIPLIVSTIGGKAGGGSTLTVEAKELIMKYELFEYEARRVIEKEFISIFGGNR